MSDTEILNQTRRCIDFPKDLDIIIEVQATISAEDILGLVNDASLLRKLSYTHPTLILKRVDVLEHVGEL